MNQLVCTACEKNYPLNDPRWCCDCGSILDLDFQPSVDPDRIASRKPTMWRYREVIPVVDDAAITGPGSGSSYYVYAPVRLTR